MQLGSRIWALSVLRCCCHRYQPYHYHHHHPPYQLLIYHRNRSLRTIPSLYANQTHVTTTPNLTSAATISRSTNTINATPATESTITNEVFQQTETDHADHERPPGFTPSSMPMELMDEEQRDATRTTTVASSTGTIPTVQTTTSSTPFPGAATAPPARAPATTTADKSNLVLSAQQADPFLAVKKDPDTVKDSELMFRSIWNKLLDKYREENMSFPKDIMWLAGAPGAGKGAMTPLIMDYRGITAKPVEVGALLTSPQAMNMKSAGKLVGDRQVIELLFDFLLKSEYQSGVLVDGFPRTKEQAECIKFLYDQMNLLRRKYANSPLYYKFPRPIFHMTVLYIDKDESVRRQLRRGKLAQIHNDIVATTGIGEMKPIRETDLDVKLAEERYRLFKTQVYESLKVVKEKFHFHFINAEGGPTEVQERILKELKYQSAMELGDETFERVRIIPLASEVILNARYELIKRLDNYQLRQSVLFEQVIQVILNEFVHIIKRQALSGRAIIRSNNPVFNEKIAIDMALDLLTERGYTVVLDVKKKQNPEKIDLKTGEVIMKEYRVFEFQIEFNRPSIRKG